MIPIHPIRMMIIGGILVTFAVCASFAMVLRLAESTFLLNFATYIASIMGLFFAIIGGVEYNSQQNWRD